MTDLGTTSGIDLDELDPAVRPQDDLFRHVNGKWIDRTEIPADKARWGIVLPARRGVREGGARDHPRGAGRPGRHRGTQVRRPLRQLHGRGARRAARRQPRSRPTSPRSTPSPRSRPCSARSAASSARASPAPSRSSSTTTRATRSATSSSSSRAASACPTSPTTARRNSPPIRDGLPRPSTTRMFELAGLPDAAARARRVFDLETELAGHHWDNVKSRDSEKAYNLKTWAGLGPRRRRRPAPLAGRRSTPPRRPSRRSSCASRAS